MKGMFQALLLSGIALWNTASAVRTKTIWLPSNTCPAPSPSGSSTVIVYTTTDSRGSTITTSTTSFFSTSKPYTSVGVYSTTNSLGSSYLTSTTEVITPGPLPSSTTLILSTTDSRGSSVIYTSVSVASSAATPSATTCAASIPAGASADYPCPASFAQPFTASNCAVFQIYCDTNFYYQDLPSVPANAFDECINACAAYVPDPTDSDDKPCVAVSYTSPGVFGNNCYLKSGIAQVIYQAPGYRSARLQSYPNPPGLSVSVVSSTYMPPTGTVTDGVSTTSTSPTSFTSVQPASPCPVSAFLWDEETDANLR